MKVQRHDYTKAAEAERLLYEAQQAFARDEPFEAEKRIAEARETLQRYLNEDNTLCVDEDE